MFDAVQKGGVCKLLAGGVPFAVMFLVLMQHGDLPQVDTSPIVAIAAAICIGTPGALALAGVIELIFGVPFLSLSDQWDALSAIRRGLLGTAIVIAAATLIFGTLLLVGWLMHPET